MNHFCPLIYVPAYHDTIMYVHCITHKKMYVTYVCYVCVRTYTQSVKCRREYEHIHSVLTLHCTA